MITVLEPRAQDARAARTLHGLATIREHDDRILRLREHRSDGPT